MIQDMIAIIRDYWLLLLIGQYPNGPLGGLANTLILSALSIALAFPVSILFAMARLSKSPLLRWPVTALVYFTRGVPLLMLILWSYFLVPLMTGADVPSFVTMLTTLVVYQSAFLSEVVRAGIVALGPGQMDAARALGHGYFGAMRYIILPQALYNMIPSIISTFVSTIKDTTLGYVINVPDLTFAASQVNNQLLTQPFQVFLILAIVYFIICWTLTYFANRLERRITRRRAGLSSLPVASLVTPSKNCIGAVMTMSVSAQASQTIQLSQVCKSYGDYPVLKNIDAQVARGEVVVICGPSGSGKSTLIRTINRLEEINSGSITLDGQNIHASMRAKELNAMRSRIGFVFQNFNLFPHLSVAENVSMSPVRVKGVAPEVAHEKALKLLDRVGLADKARAIPVSCPAASSSGWRSPVRLPWSRR